MNIPKKFNLQFFAEEGEDKSISTVNGLDALLSGNTTEAETEATDPVEEDTNPEDHDTEGGDTDLNDSDDNDPEADQEDKKKDEEPEQSAAAVKANAAFAKMRSDNARLNKVISGIAEALGLDPKNGDVIANLSELATKKLAEQKKLPVEVYNELTQTREQLQMLTQKQNIDTARGKLNEVRTKYALDDKAIGSFLDAIEAEGIDPISDPSIDLEYHYYRLNKDKILEAAREQARQEAIKNSKAGNATKPDKLTGRRTEASDKKIDSVKGLDELLSGK